MRSDYVRRNEHTALQLKNLIPSVKHGGGSVMDWACFTASCPGQPAIIDGTMNSELYQNIINKTSGNLFKNSVSRERVMQQDN